MSEHLCHAAGCETPCPPRMFMCRADWRAIPKPLQSLIWRYYKPGQESKGGVTWEYLYASQRVVEWLAARQGIPHDGMADGFRDAADQAAVEQIDAILARQP